MPQGSAQRWRVRRREFITLLGCVSVAWPLAASAQQTDQVRHIGLFLVIDADAPETKARLEGFRRGLKELGWSEGRNLRLEFRYAPAIRIKPTSSPKS
jgi:putative tryptophan/tyrosine transport system substrate-binding protein